MYVDVDRKKPALAMPKRERANARLGKLDTRIPAPTHHHAYFSFSFSDTFSHSSSVLAADLASARG